jgi:predicted dehydrogenase
MNAENYHAVVIGCGRGGENIGAHSIGYVHGKAYRDNPRIELAGACDLDPANLDRFCEQFSVPYKTGNSEELLRELCPELVSICTYVGSRPALVEASVRNGAKAIWCEKPLSLTIQEGRRLVELCEENGVKLVINHYRRYLDLWNRVKQLIKDREGGRDPFQDLLNDFLAWIEAGQPPRINARSGLASTELYLACYESSKRRDRIDLPLPDQDGFPLDAIAAGSLWLER